MKNPNKIVPICEIVPDTPEQIQTQTELMRMAALIVAQRFILDGCPSIVLVTEAVQDEFQRLVQNLTESKIINTGD